MLHILTASATALTALLIVQFVLGLVQLWHSSEPNQISEPQAFESAPKPTLATASPWLEAPQNEFDTDVWLMPLTPSEAPTVAANEIVKSSFTYQLCLPPANVGTEPLEGLSIRQLKELAKQAKLKSYGKLTKKELVLALQ